MMDCSRDIIFIEHVSYFFDPPPQEENENYSKEQMLAFFDFNHYGYSNMERYEIKAEHTLQERKHVLALQERLFSQVYTRRNK